MRPRYLAAGAVAMAALMSACSSGAVTNVVDQATSKAGAVVSQVECAAISQAQQQLAKVSTADPSTLDDLSGAAGTVVNGLAALGDKVPAGTQGELVSAQKELDAAIARAKADPSAKADLTAAADKFGSTLDTVSASISC